MAQPPQPETPAPTPPRPVGPDIGAGPMRPEQTEPQEPQPHHPPTGEHIPAPPPPAEQRRGNAGNKQSMPKPPQDSERDSEIRVPDAVRAAWMLWIFAACCAVLGQAAALLPGAYRMSPTELREALPSNQGAQFSDAQLAQITELANVFGVISSVVIAIIVVLLARTMRRGRNWARILLTIIGLVTTVIGISALMVLLNGGSDTQRGEPVVEFVRFAAQGLAGLFAGTAVWQMSNYDALKFFQDRSHGQPRR